MSGVLHVQLLGEFGLAFDGARVGAVSSPRLRILLAYLILHRSAPQLRQHLAFLFWPDSDEEQARTNLRNLVHLLRHALPHSDCCLRCEGQALVWEPHVSYRLDVTEFEEAIASGAAERAIALYRGDLLPDCYDDWIIPERERLRRLYLEALQQAAQEQELAHNYPAALGYAERLAREEPLSETHCRRLLRLQMLNGDRATALRTYHACATALRRELGVDPALATQQLHAQILQGIESPAAPLPPAPSEAHLPLVGRSSEWRRLLTEWELAARGRPRCVVVTGDAGIGKTRLAEELLARASEQGAPAAVAVCHQVEGRLPYGPVIAWLRSRPLPRLHEAWLEELARLLPDAAPQHALRLGQRGDAPGERYRLFEALAHAIRGWTVQPAAVTGCAHAAASLAAPAKPLLLFIDNLQWCDPDTLEWLHFLLRFDPHAPFLVAATLTSGEPVEQPLAGLLATLAREDLLAEIELAPLSREDTFRLAGDAAGRPLDACLADGLYRASEGNPLFAIEMIRAGAGSPEPWNGERDEVGLQVHHRLPLKVRQVVAARLAQLSPVALSLAELVAVGDRTCDFGLLARALAADEAVLVEALDELRRRRILREADGNGYEFAHGVIREVCYEGMSTARRRLAQRRLAGAAGVHAVHPNIHQNWLCHC